MKNWTIAKRIMLGGALLLATLITVGAFGGLALRHIESLTISRLRDDAIPGIVSMAAMNAQTLRGHIRVLMAGQAGDAQERDQHIVRMRENAAAAVEATNTYEAAMTNDEDRANFAKLQQAQTAYRAEREKYLELLTSGRVAEASVFINEKLDPVYIAYRQIMADMLDWNQRVAVAATDEIVAETHRVIMRTLVCFGAGLLVAVVAGWLIIRGINRTLRNTAGVLDDASNQLSAAAGQVSSSSQSLAEGASQQAASLEETSSSLEELAPMTQRNADGAQTAKRLSSETRAAAESGNGDMTEMRQAMEAIKTSSTDISKIIKTIDEIAFKTNILALNAAVEAARAGDAGAGFAVVAEEVRALAQRSADSAKETASKIEVAINCGEVGVRISERVAQSLGQIVEKVRQVDELVGEISTASQDADPGHRPDQHRRQPDGQGHPIQRRRGRGDRRRRRRTQRPVARPARIRRRSPPSGRRKLNRRHKDRRACNVGRPDPSPSAARAAAPRGAKPAPALATAGAPGAD